MLYLKPGEPITDLTIASNFDSRATVEAGYLDSQLVFQVKVLGGCVGYIVPPSHEGAWGINLSIGAYDLIGYFRPIINEMDAWDLEYFAPL